MKRETSRDMDQHGKNMEKPNLTNLSILSIIKTQFQFHPKNFIFQKQNLLLIWAQGHWALESVCLMTFLPSFEVKELGRRLLELHHVSCRRHSVNCRVDSVASWFHGNCTCRIFHRQLCVCVCVPPKNCRGDLNDFCCTQNHSNPNVW